MLLQFSDDYQMNNNALISEFYDSKMPDFKNSIFTIWHKQALCNYS